MKPVKNAREMRMIGKILVAPREFAVDLSKRKKTKGLAVISICSWERDVFFTEAVKKSMNCQDIISLVFADLTAKDYKIAPALLKKYPRFNMKMARKIITFIDKIKVKDIKLLLIHCDAGVSRSPAVGVWAVRYLSLNGYIGHDEDEFRREHPAIGPNTLVYDVLSKASGLRKDYGNWWENVHIDPKYKLIF